MIKLCYLLFHELKKIQHEKQSCHFSGRLRLRFYLKREILLSLISLKPVELVFPFQFLVGCTVEKGSGLIFSFGNSLTFYLSLS